MNPDFKDISQILTKAKKTIAQGQKFLTETKISDKITKLKKQIVAPNFWHNHSQAEKISRELSIAEKTVKIWQELDQELNTLNELLQTAEPSELTSEIENFAKRVKQAEIRLFLSGEFDNHAVILTINVGAGGVDAADWAAMLLRMFLRFTEKRGWQSKILEKSVAEEAGIKSATVEISGEFVFGFLKSERGTHRLVRRSPFNSTHSRETSFAKVEVLPKINNDIEIKIRSEDFKVDTFCASGAGGQHVNRTESAVRITHLPTGLVASCQNQRSQQQNRVQALEILRGKLAEQKLIELENQERKLRGEPLKADFGGDTIRSYVLDDKRVKDVRTGLETRDPEKVLDGDLDEFVEGFLLMMNC
jgi:peptide chain release factor 2